MFGSKGQAFDAFKLLIAAVVAGAILVILLGMLGGFITPAGDPINVMAQSISKVKGAPGSGSVSAQTVQFKKDDIVSSDAVETKAGVNPGSIGFCFQGEFSDCGAKACPDGYQFEKFFSGEGGGTGEDFIQAEEDVSGKIRVYNCGKETDNDISNYWIGFKAVS